MSSIAPQESPAHSDDVIRAQLLEKAKRLHRKSGSSFSLPPKVHTMPVKRLSHFVDELEERCTNKKRKKRAR